MALVTFLHSFGISVDNLRRGTKGSIPLLVTVGHKKMAIKNSCMNLNSMIHKAAHSHFWFVISGLYEFTM